MKDVIQAFDARAEKRWIACVRYAHEPAFLSPELPYAGQTFDWLLSIRRSRLLTRQGRSLAVQFCVPRIGVRTGMKVNSSSRPVVPRRDRPLDRPVPSAVRCDRSLAFLIPLRTHIIKHTSRPLKRKSMIQCRTRMHVRTVNLLESRVLLLYSTEGPKTSQFAADRRARRSHFTTCCSLPIHNLRFSWRERSAGPPENAGRLAM